MICTDVYNSAIATTINASDVRYYLFCFKCVVYDEDKISFITAGMDSL